MRLPDAFLARPIAHRGYHGAGAAENSRSAFERAVAARYGIELDLQLSSDSVAVVFHDYTLDRLTHETGVVRHRSAKALSALALSGGGGAIPTLHDILALVDGRVPLLIELKDQDGAFGPNIGPLEEATAATLHGYTGPVAVMSFNPHSVAACQTLLPDVPRGLVTCGYDPARFPHVPSDRRAQLRGIPDAARVGASFVSHDIRDLNTPRLQELKDDGLTLFGWTIRSAAEEDCARRVVDNVTFEHYAA